MATALLDINLDAITANWQALGARTGADCETAAVVKADAYGLGAARVAARLADAGVQTFFVATAEEGAAIRRVVGAAKTVAVLSGHMSGDGDLLAAHDLIPVLDSPAQIDRHLDRLPGHPFGVQLDTGMNRLGLEPADWADCRDRAMAADPWLAISHLACADEAEHPQNATQLAAFHDMTDGLPLRRSLAATGGIMLGPDFHFDLTRPGIGLYGGAPFSTALQVVELTIPVIQCRDVAIGESVGYGASWIASRPSRIATLQAGYADGLIRAMSNSAILHAGRVPCPLVGRVSMDLLTVDITDLEDDPDHLQILGPYQGIDALADATGTIGYEILSALGARYRRRYNRGVA